MVAAQETPCCDACSLPARLCLCALVPRVETRTRLVLAINGREARKKTNTGLLAARCLVNSEVHVVGRPDHPIDFAALLPAAATNLVLFPTPEAIPLTPDFCAALSGPIRLLALDGNWGQASRLRRKLPPGGPATYVTLVSGAPSAYGLRRRPRDLPAGLSTIEAIARALAVLEGPPASEALLTVLHALVERTLWMRGRRPGPPPTA